MRRNAEFTSPRTGIRYWIDGAGHAKPIEEETPAEAVAERARNACEGGKCGPQGTWSCSKHGAEYQRRYGRAENE